MLHNGLQENPQREIANENPATKGALDKVAIRFNFEVRCIVAPSAGDALVVDLILARFDQHSPEVDLNAAGPIERIEK